MSRNCPSCKNKFLDLLFDYYARNKLIKKEDICFKCKFEQHLLGPIFDFLLSKYVTVSNAPGGMRDIFSNSYFRRYLMSVLNGIGKFGIKPPLVYGAPITVTWNLTKRCNLNCPHCYQEGSPDTLPNEVTTKEIFSTLVQLADYGVLGMLFGGGEPLMHPDIYKILRFTLKLEMFANLSTNGILITEKVAKKLKDIKITRVTISLDGIGDTHDKMRGGHGIYDKTIRGIQNAKNVGLEVAIAFTLTQLNYKEIPEIISLAKEFKLDSILLNNFVPIGRGKENSVLDVTPEKREKILHILYDELVQANNNDSDTIDCFTGASPFYCRIAYQTHVKEGYNKPIPVTMQTCETLINRFDIHDHYKRRLREYFPRMVPFIAACTIATSYACIDPEGYILPCTLIPIRLGNIRTDKFSNVWEKNLLLNKLRNRKNVKGVCRDCKFYTCRGCKARAYAYTGDIFESDPGCLYGKKNNQNFF